MKPWRFFIFSNILYALVACYLYWQLNLASDALIYVLAHFFLASVANTILIKKVIKHNICLVSSPVSCFLIITQVYITFSSLKYFADNSTFYPMFELTKADQFIGSLLGLFVVFVILFSLGKSYFVTPNKFVNWVTKYVKVILFLSIILVCISVLTKVALVNQGYGSTYSDSLFTKLELRKRSDAILLNINEIVDQFLIIYFFLLYQIYRNSQRQKIIKYIYLLITISFFLYNLLFFKSRLLILFFLVIVILMIQAFQPRKGLLYLSILFMFLPITIGILPLLNGVLGRDNLMSDSLEILIQITSYRADLTDYAYAILKKSNFIGLNPDIILQSLLNAIPNVLFPGKDLVTKDAYSIGLDKIGWEAKSDTSIEIIDYQDSFFSAGAMSVGIVGFILVPIIFLKILNYLSVLIDRKLAFGFSAILIFPLISIALKVEVEFSNIFINMRNSIQMTLITFLLSYFYTRFHSRRFPKYLSGEIK